MQSKVTRGAFCSAMPQKPSEVFEAFQNSRVCRSIYKMICKCPVLVAHYSVEKRSPGAKLVWFFSEPPKPFEI